MPGHVNPQISCGGHLQQFGCARLWRYIATLGACDMWQTKHTFGPDIRILCLQQQQALQHRPVADLV